MTDTNLLKHQVYFFLLFGIKKYLTQAICQQFQVFFSVVNDQMETKGIDRLLKVVGGFGRWQCFFLLLGTWSCIVAATNHVAIVFIGDSPKFRCFDQSHFNVSQACLDKNGNTCSEFIFDTTVYRSTLVTKWNLVCDRLIFLPLIQVTT